MSSNRANAQIDHIITFANVASIDTYIKEYQARGFIVHDDSPRYKPGLRNRFVSLGCEYIELVWVEDEAAFAVGGEVEFALTFPNLKALRSPARPFGIGLVTQDAEALHQNWTERGYHVPDVWTFTPPGHPPVFSFQNIPLDLLPGVGSFALMYHSTVPGQERRMQIAPNSVYALEGLTMISDEPETKATQWRDLLAPGATIQQQDGVHSFMVGAHTVHWMMPDVFRQCYGLEWTEAPHGQGAIAVLHLLVSDLSKAEAMLGAKRIQVSDTDTPYLTIPANSQDGLAFILREYPAEQWRAERMAKTGEKIIVLNA